MMPANTAFYDANEVADLLGISKSLAYVHIRTLNKQIKEQGYLTPKAGLVPKQLIHEKFMLSGTAATAEGKLIKK